MRKLVESLVAVEMLVAIVVLALVGMCGVARAEPAQQFSLRLGTEPSGRVSLQLRLRAYDTTGVVPPAPTDYYVRFPRGAGINRAFLTPRWLCDGQALRDALNKDISPVPFSQRITNLKPFIRSLERSRSRSARKALANARVCERARLGNGTGLIDARNVTSVLQDPIPVRFTVFFSRGTEPGSVAGTTVLGSADERASIVKRYPVLAGVHVAIDESIVEDPTPDGLYGLKLLLPTGPIAGFDVRLAQIETTARSLLIRRGTCLRTSPRGRCTARQATDAHLFIVPKCAPGSQLSALIFTGFAPPTPSISSTVAVPCPPAYVR